MIGVVRIRLVEFLITARLVASESQCDQALANLELPLYLAVLDLGDHQRQSLFVHFTMNIQQNFDFPAIVSFQLMVLMFLSVLEYFYPVLPHWDQGPGNHRLAILA